jgi:hypothetical protein
MQMKKQVEEGDPDSEAFVRRFPEDLKNFFGRQFKLEDVNEVSKKKSNRSQILKNRFHLEGLKAFLYHSYLQPRTKLKYITYRTPFRIFNVTPNKIMLKFRFGNRTLKNDRWGHEISSKEYYSIPEDIYQCDFLVNFAASKRRHRDNLRES